MRRLSMATLLGLSVAVVAGCQPQSATSNIDKPQEHAHHVSSSAVPSKPATAPNASAQHIVVHKSPTCGCCNDWITHLEGEGFHVEAVNHANMGDIKSRLGVPHGMGSCHTAEVEGYVIEGHVPAQDIHRLLKEKPKARGLTVPGMPLGSPGMEMGDTREPYTVFLIKPDGTTESWSEYGQ